MCAKFEFFKWSGKKAVAIFVLTIALILVAVDVTVTYLVDKTEPADNIFEPPVLHISLDGIDDITNTGNVPVYVRALSVANWRSVEDENTYLSVAPKVGVDFSVEFLKDGWFLCDDGFYYYKNILQPGKDVQLFTKVTQLKEMSGYELHLEIISTGIQAYPSEAVSNSWPVVTVTSDGKLAPVATP